MVFLPRMAFLISTAKSRNLTSLQGSAQMLPLPHSLPWYPLLKLMSILLLWALIGTVLTFSCHVVLFICVRISAPWGTCGQVPLPYTIYSLSQSSELLQQSHSSHLIVIEYLSPQQRTELYPQCWANGRHPVDTGWRNEWVNKRFCQSSFCLLQCPTHSRSPLFL